MSRFKATAANSTYHRGSRRYPTLLQILPTLWRLQCHRLSRRIRSPSSPSYSSPNRCPPLFSPIRTDPLHRWFGLADCETILPTELITPCQELDRHMNRMKLRKEEPKPGVTYRQKAKQSKHYSVFFWNVKSKNGGRGVPEATSGSTGAGVGVSS